MSEAVLYIEKVKDFLQVQADWQFNKLTGNVEWKNELTGGRWMVVGEYEINTLADIYLTSQFSKISPAMLQRVIRSHFVDKVDPILNYFEELAPWNEAEEGDYMAQIAETMDCNHAHLVNFFKKWMVAVVANVYDREGCDNHVCLCLRGPQGVRKTSFFQAIVPPGLSNYAHIGFVDSSMKNKELPQMMICNILVVFDDCLDMNLRIRPQETKGLITMPQLRFRMSYEKGPDTWPKNCSFGATLNEENFLNDTENRRWLVFDVKKIDHATLKKIPMGRAWAQARDTFMKVRGEVHEHGAVQGKGFRYWFTKAEQAIIEEENGKYLQLSEEETMIDKYFEIPTGENHKEEATVYLPPAEIISRIKRQEKNFNATSSKVGRALSTLGAQRWQRTMGGKKQWVYSLVERDPEGIEGQYMNPDKKAIKPQVNDRLREEQDARRVAQLFATTPNSDFQ